MPDIAALFARPHQVLDDADHALHAIDAALGMLRALDGLNAELAQEADSTGAKPLELRIGETVREMWIGVRSLRRRMVS